MKAHVKVVELDGTADEIARIIAGFSATPVIEQPAPQTPFIEPGDVEEGDHPLRAVPPRDRVVTSLAAAAYDAAGVEDAPRPSGEVLDGGPFASPHDIPAEWRLFNGSGMTCHIRTQPGLAVAMCPASRKTIGARRLHDTEVPFKNTEVCEACNKALEYSRRKA